MQIGIGLGIGFGSKVRRAVVRDSFNRADNSVTPGNADSGQAWVTQGASVFGIQSNQLKSGSAASGYAYIDSGLSDCEVTIKYVTMFTAQRLLLRWVDVNNEVYLDTSTSTAGLTKRVAGTTTSLGSFPMAAGDTVRVVMAGSSIKVYLNGVLKQSITETFNQTATKQGVKTSPAFGSIYDDFSVTTL